MEKSVAMALAAVLMAGLMIHFLRSRSQSVASMLSDVEVPELLVHMSKEMSDPQVIQVTDDIHVAINYALGNSILLVGSSGAVIVDTTESIDAATAIAAEFRKITDKPIQTIIYTHHHTDHITGTKAFITDPDNLPQIIAHHLMKKELKKIQMTGRIHGRRAMFQFGNYLHDYSENSGIGMRLRVDLDKYDLQAPSKYIEDDEYDLDVAGLKLQLIHIPGETSDQMGVWLPDKRVFLVGDDVYQCFPNLYAIRGTTPRDVTDWVESLEKIRSLRPRILVGSHHKPIFGEENVYSILTSYKAGIQYVHDQTVRYINQGMHPDEIAKLVRLPPDLANHEYLQECYGTVPWSVKGIYISYMGWFSGLSEELYPLTPTERGERMMKILGRRHVLRLANDALKDGDVQWALELASHVFTVYKTDTEAMRIRREAMKKLASIQSTANGRNYYLTTILGDMDLLPSFDVRKMAKTLPMSRIFQAMRVRLKAEDTVGVDSTACFNFTDTQVTHCLHIHKGVLEVLDKFVPDCDYTLTTTESAWRDVLSGNQSPLRAYISGALKIEGGLLGFRHFMDYFERN